MENFLIKSNIPEKFPQFKKKTGHITVESDIYT